MYKTNILETIIDLGIDAYLERITAFLGRRALEGKPTSDDTNKRLRDVYEELIDIRFKKGLRMEFNAEGLPEYIKRIESLG